MSKVKRNIVAVVAGTILLVVGAVSYALISSSVTSVKYSLLANRIQTERPNEVKINFTQLRKELTEYLGSNGELGQKTSVYFEYLPTGVSINLNEATTAVGASLMKVPAVMNLYKGVELGVIDMDEKIALKQEWLNDQYGTLYQKGAGYQISPREAAKLTLQDSDNTALLLIWDQVGSLNNSDVGALNYLDVDYSLRDDGTLLIGAKSYSSILKCLYFACHNTMDHAQEILNYLTGSNFTDRLARHIPKDVKVAHKIGTFNDDFQSDCGIFYIEKRHYILCVMVPGPDPEASRLIADLSKITYDYMLARDQKSLSTN